MCGIAGIANFKEDGEGTIRRMNARLARRGPDAEGIWRNPGGNVFFGHRRLSVIDLTEGGAQPFLSASGRYACVYNGELYNFREIRQQLLSSGAVTTWRGNSDTEVLVEAVEAFGVKEALQRCKGMFAFALYDHRTHEILLARDRIGEKPLYYGFVDDQFVFASDIGCFREAEGFAAKIEERVLPVYLAHGYIPAPYSIYQGVYKLMPGTVLKIRAPYQSFAPVYPAKEQSGSGYEIFSYYDIDEVAAFGLQHPFTGSREEAAEQLEQLLTQAVRGQMTADVPLGAFLSGGIDSATVVALMQHTGTTASGMERVMRAKEGRLGDGRVRTFTIGFEDAEYDESAAAKEIARHLGTHHTELKVSEKQAKEMIPLLPQMYTEPFADSSQIPTYLVSRMTRQHVTVSLSGDGGDELFSGYRSYDSAERIWGKLKRVPYDLRAGMGRMLLGKREKALEAARTGDDDWLLFQTQTAHDKALLLTARTPEDLYRIQAEALDARIADLPLCKEVLPDAHRVLPQSSIKDARRALMLQDLKMYHPDDILVKVDRAAMAVSLETRIPMLDPDVVAFSWTLPMRYLHDETGGKLLLKDVLHRHVPKELTDRPKKGFSVPVAKWLTEPELRDWAEDLLNAQTIRQQGLLHAETVRRYWEDFTGKGWFTPQIWYLLMFEQWMKESR